MNEILLVVVILISLFILRETIRTIIETRRRYYNDYMKRKRDQ
jgi:hypothetical protein